MIVRLLLCHGHGELLVLEERRLRMLLLLLLMKVVVLLLLLVLECVVTHRRVAEGSVVLVLVVSLEGRKHRRSNAERYVVLFVESGSPSCLSFNIRRVAAEGREHRSPDGEGDVVFLVLVVSRCSRRRRSNVHRSGRRSRWSISSYLPDLPSLLIRDPPAVLIFGDAEVQAKEGWSIAGAGVGCRVAALAKRSRVGGGAVTSAATAEAEKKRFVGSLLSRERRQFGSLRGGNGSVAHGGSHVTHQYRPSQPLRVLRRGLLLLGGLLGRLKRRRGEGDTRWEWWWLVVVVFSV